MSSTKVLAPGWAAVKRISVRDLNVPDMPFSALDSNDEEKLWAWMAEQGKGMRGKVEPPEAVVELQRLPWPPVRWRPLRPRPRLGVVPVSGMIVQGKGTPGRMAGSEAVVTRPRSGSPRSGLTAPHSLRLEHVQPRARNAGMGIGPPRAG